MTKQHGAHEPTYAGARSTHDDLFYKAKHRKGWKSLGRRYPYKGERLSIPQIAKRAGKREEAVRKRLNDWDWSVEKLFNKYGDTQQLETSNGKHNN